MKKGILALCLVSILYACSTSKIIPIKLSTPNPSQTFIEDTIGQNLAKVSGIGVSLANVEVTKDLVEQVLSESNAAWIQLQPTGGLSNLFKVISATTSQSATKNEGIQPDVLRQILLAHHTKLALVIDPALDQENDIIAVSHQLKDWQIPFSHWQIASLPYLELLNTPAPLWISGKDFAVKMKRLSTTLKKINASQPVFYSAGNTNRNLFTDEILQTESEYHNWSRLALYNFLGKQKNISEYLFQRFQNPNPFIIHIIGDQSNLSPQTYAQFFDQVLSYKSHMNDLMVDLQFENEFSGKETLMKGIKQLNKLISANHSLQTLYTPKNINKDTSIQSITIFRDTAGTKKIVFANPYDKSIYIDLSSELDSLKINVQSFTLYDSLFTNTETKRIRIRPFSMNIVSETKDVNSQHNDLIIKDIKLVDSSRILISWNDDDPYAIYKIRYGQNKLNPENETETKLTNFLFNNLLPGRTYYFFIQGWDLNTNISNIQEVTYTAIPPETPMLLPQLRDEQKLTVRWTPMPHAQNYTLRIFHNGIIEEIETGEVTTFVIDSIYANRTYRFAVKASNIYGESNFSSTSEASTKGALPPPPKFLRMEGNAFKWNAPSGIDQSKISYLLFSGSSPSELVQVQQNIVDTVYYDLNTYETDHYYAVCSKNKYGYSGVLSNVLTVERAENKNLSIFDVYETGDSTNIVIKYVPDNSGNPPISATLIIQDRNAINWIEERIDCKPYLQKNLNQYRLRLPQNMVENKVIFVVEK